MGFVRGLQGGHDIRKWSYFLGAWGVLRGVGWMCRGRIGGSEEQAISSIKERIWRKDEGCNRN
jgi:hypothetical protein